MPCRGDRAFRRGAALKIRRQTWFQVSVFRFQVLIIGILPEH
jgi:hypothetical protein